MANKINIKSRKRSFFEEAPVNIRARLFYGTAVATMVVLGLGSGIFSAYLPGFISLHFGDALRAAMVYFGLRVLLLNRGISFAALAALLFSFSIEFSQLYQAEWINEIRRSLAGSLILGRGFLAIDLIRYAAGIMFSYLADRFVLSRYFSSKK